MKPELQKAAEKLPTNQGVRELVLESAGLSADRMSTLLASAVTKIEEKLKATETKFFSHQGEVVETRQVDNHAIQLAAAIEMTKFIKELASLKGNVSTDKKPPIAIQINLPEGNEKIEEEVTDLTKDIPSPHTP